MTDRATNKELQTPDSEEFKFGQLVAKNTFINYFSIGVKFVSSIFLTYLLYKGLGREFYGFWSLLWTIFMFSLVLDLGFGKAVEKYTAEASFTGNIEKFNSILSSIIFGYSLMSIVIIILGSIMSLYLDKMFTLSVGEYTLNISYYRRVFILFTVGAAVVFPTGVFPTILSGLQRNYLRNYVIIFNKLIELAGVWVIFYTENSLMTLIIFTTSINLLSNLVMAIMAFRLMPGLRIGIRHIKLHTIKYIADFSVFTYLLMICDLIIFQTDRVLLAIMTNLSGVAVYHLATKIPQIICMASTQFQSNLAPVAAILHKSGETDRLQQTMFHSTRITVFICTGAFAVFIPLVRPVLYTWLKVDDALTISLTYILIMSMYILIIFRDTAKHFLLMTGHHRTLASIAFAEAASNLLLSIILIKLIGVLGVAWGTLIPNVIISIMIVFPLAARQSGSTPLAYLGRVYIPIFVLAGPIIIATIYSVHHIPLQDWNFAKLFVTASITGTLYLLTGWLFYVSHEERIKLCSFLPSFIPQKIVKLIAW